MSFDRSRYEERFNNEARHHLEEISRGMREVLNPGEWSERAGRILRHAHTLAGSATLMGEGAVARMARGIERILEESIACNALKAEEIRAIGLFLEDIAAALRL